MMSATNAPIIGHLALHRGARIAGQHNAGEADALVARRWLLLVSPDEATEGRMLKSVWPVKIQEQCERS